MITLIQYSRGCTYLLLDLLGVVLAHLVDAALELDGLAVLVHVTLAL